MEDDGDDVHAEAVAPRPRQTIGRLQSGVSAKSRLSQLPIERRSFGKPPFIMVDLGLILLWIFYPESVGLDSKLAKPR